MSLMNTREVRLHNDRINFEIIYLDGAEDNCIQSISNYIRFTTDFAPIIFENLDECIDYMTDMNDLQVFLIVSGSSAINIIPMIEQLEQIQTIHKLSSNTSTYKH
ncbi:hypothetical protein I4U23_004655 [Adineta vaga]|nr:hypothetical protein I4U23_004655 [Adineta vaga]